MSDGGPPARATERRARARRSCTVENAPVALASIGAEIWPLSVRDISPFGLGVLLDRRLDVGTVLPVELLNRGQDFWHLKPLRVVHVTPQGNGLWLVGSVFLKELSDDDLRALLE